MTDAGASAGAWCCLFMSLGLSTEEWTHSYRLSHRAEDREAIHNAYRDEVWPWLKSIIPVDAYKVSSYFESTATEEDESTFWFDSYA